VTPFPAWIPPQLPILGSELRFPTRRIWCVGQNYASHAREMGTDPTRDPPFFFAKPSDSATAATVIPYPPKTADLHHEIELVVGLSAPLADADPARARAAILGYAVGLDLTRRDLQAAAKAKGRPWTLAKGFDLCAPVSPLALAADIGHPRAGRIWCAVDGVTRQDADLSQMTWSVEELLVVLSQFVTLQAGDLIFTGTPAGVGPLAPGAHVTGGIAGVGELAVAIGGA
jgi:fumarylpyruvate hydrolase